MARGHTEESFLDDVDLHQQNDTKEDEDQPSGTIPYMAPEFLENKNVIFTEKTEVYSFGVLLWEIFSDPKLVREGPYPNMQPVQILFQVVNNGLRPKIQNNSTEQHRESTTNDQREFTFAVHQ